MRRTTLRHQGRIVSTRWYWSRIGEPPPLPRPREPRYRYAILIRSRFHSIYRLRLIDMTIASQRDWMKLRHQQRGLTIFPDHP